jgi:hypothetical protein
MATLFSGPPKPPPAPAPVPIPDPMDPAVLAARQRLLSQAAARSGRASTLLSGGEDATDTLGQR